MKIRDASLMEKKTDLLTNPVLTTTPRGAHELYPHDPAVPTSCQINNNQLNERLKEI